MWRALNAGDIEDVLNHVEMHEYRRLLLAPGQVDPLPDLMDKVTQEMRGYIRGCAANREIMGPVSTLPVLAIGHAAVLVRTKLLTRLKLKIDEGRLVEHRDALTFCRDLSACKVAITEADEKADEKPASSIPSPSIRARRKQFTRRDQDGI